MYKIVIVDDELDVRSRLVSLIKKIEGDFELIAAYENGLDAFEGLSSESADILITDIKIPYIDGIELIERIKKQNPLTQAIIISGYDEFDYAQRAIDLGVIGYLTKPITFDVLSKFVNKAKDALDTEYLTQTNFSKLEELRKKSKALYKENDLKLLFNMNSLAPKYKERFEYNGIDLNYDYFAVAYFDYDKPIYDLKYSDYETTQLGIINAIKDVFTICDYDSFTKNDRIALLIKSKTEINLNDISKKLEVIVNKVNRFSNERISVGISDVAYKEYHFKDLFKNAKKALEVKNILGQETVHLYDEVYNNNLPGYIDEEIFKDFNYSIMYLNEEDIKENLNIIKKTLIDTCNIDNQYYVLSKLLNNIVKCCDNVEVLYHSYMNYTDLYRRLFENKSIDNIFLQLEELSFKVKEVNDSIKIKTINKNFERILNYIQKNYKNSDISLEYLASEVNYSVSYISALFKKEMNTSFVKYVTGLKMEEAKRLLSMPNMKIVNVSDELGFTEPYYFSHCFKKYFGISPKEFKNNEAR